MLTAEDLKLLQQLFPKETLGVKVQSFSKDRSKACLVLYLQHTDVANRLDEVDPTWSFAVTDQQFIGDTVYVRAKLTIKGVTRENVGDGNDPKSAASDALKRCAMLFGVGRHLYDTETVWVEYNEQRDRYRSWTVDDYDHASRNGKAPTSDEPPQGQYPQGPAQARQQSEAPRRPIANPFKPEVGASNAPVCCGKPMMISRYAIKGHAVNPWYCTGCKTAKPRSAVA